MIESCVAATTNFALSHRATAIPGADVATDRLVICDGLLIGRVRQVEAGQQAALWQWSCFWIGTDTRGTAEALAEALALIRGRVTAKSLQALPPEPPAWNR